MNETEIKTRFGLILQGILGVALKEAGYSTVVDYQYEPTCEKPDFLIPDEKQPKFMVEVHQTEARTSFLMKILRAFMAVAESKTFFSKKLISVNVLFGDPEKELPVRNVEAIRGFFDLNVFPRQNLSNSHEIVGLEKSALLFACDNETTTEAAIKKICAKEQTALLSLSRLLRKKLNNSKPKSELLVLWELEKSRTDVLGQPPPARGATYYKRTVLKSLYIDNSVYQKIYKAKGLSECPSSLVKKLVEVRLATLKEELDGDYYDLIEELKQFISDDYAQQIRHLCEDVINSIPEMRFFFEDIRSESRRFRMAEAFLEIINKKTSSLSKAVHDNLKDDLYYNITHRRCWVADLAPRYLGVPHNAFNNGLRDLGCDPQGLGNPFNQLTYKSKRFMSQPETFEIYCQGVEKVFNKLSAGNRANMARNARDIANRLLDLRLDGAIKLKKLDPLILISQATCSRYGLRIKKVTVPTVISDLSGNSPAGKYVLYEITSPQNQSKVLFNSVAVHDNNGDHKSKEWGARRLATLYRIVDGQIRLSEYQEAIFVIDGEWADKDVARLYRSGWNHVVRLDDLEQKLREVFDIPADEELIEIPEVELPLAAEEADDGMEYHGG